MQTINARFFQENSTAIHTTLGDNGYCAYLGARASLDHRNYFEKEDANC